MQSRESTWASPGRRRRARARQPTARPADREPRRARAAPSASPADVGFSRRPDWRVRRPRLATRLRSTGSVIVDSLPPYMPKSLHPGLASPCDLRAARPGADGGLGPTTACSERRPRVSGSPSQRRSPGPGRLGLGTARADPAGPARDRGRRATLVPATSPLAPRALPGMLTSPGFAAHGACATARHDISDIGQRDDLPPSGPSSG